MAEGRGKPTTPNNKVSHNNIISKPYILRKSAGCRPGGSTDQQRCEEYPAETRGRDVWPVKTRDVRNVVTGTRDVREDVTRTRNVQNRGGGVTTDDGGGQYSVVGDREVRSGTDSIKKGVVSTQLGIIPGNPGPHHDVGGGEATVDGGGGRYGDGGGRSRTAPHKTKPKGVSGGLSARILAWEMKNQLVDENCTQSDTAGGTRIGVSNRM